MKITVKHCAVCNGKGKIGVYTYTKMGVPILQGKKKCTHKKCKGTGHIVKIEEE